MDNGIQIKSTTIWVILLISKVQNPNIQKDIPNIRKNIPVYETVPGNVKCSIISMNNTIPVDWFPQGIYSNTALYVIGTRTWYLLAK